MLQKIQEWAKAIAAGLGTVVTLAAGIPGIIPDDWSKWVQLALGVLTVIATWAIPNAPNQATINKVVASLPVATAIPYNPANTVPDDQANDAGDPDATVGHV